MRIIGTSPRFYKHMTPEKAREVRRLYFVERMKQKDIGALFGIGQNTVSRIVSRISWPHA